MEERLEIDTAGKTGLPSSQCQILGDSEYLHLFTHVYLQTEIETSVADFSSRLMEAYHFGQGEVGQDGQQDDYAGGDEIAKRTVLKRRTIWKHTRRHHNTVFKLKKTFERLAKPLQNLVSLL